MTRYWTEDAWNKLLLYTRIRHIDLKGAIDRDIDKANLAEQKIASVSKAYELLVTVLSGYYLIAEGAASDQVVADTFSALKAELSKDVGDILKYEKQSTLDQLISQLRTETGVIGHTDIGYLGALLRLEKLEGLFRRAVLRADKAIAIDTLMYMVHEEGLELMIFIGWPFRDEETEEKVMMVLDALAER